MSVATDSDAPLGANAFTFLDKSEYFRDLISCIAKTKSGDRVLVMSMEFDAQELVIQNVVNALCEAAERGVHVHLAIDGRALPLMQQAPLSRTSQLLSKAILSALSKLEASGGTYVITNDTYRRALNPFAGRSHIKLAVINDALYVGGCNLDHPEYIDMMVNWRSARTADWLYELMMPVFTHKNTQKTFAGNDKELTLDKDTKLLIDAGKPKQSIIFEHALSLIDAAEERIVLTCQFFPNDTTIKHLAAAYKHGVNVSIYYNHPNKHFKNKSHPLLHHLVLAHQRLRQPSELLTHQLERGLPYLHTKLLATEKGAIVGSHNYVTAGVNFGTAEIALLRYDPAFSKAALSAFIAQLN